MHLASKQLFLVRGEAEELIHRFHSTRKLTETVMGEGAAGSRHAAQPDGQCGTSAGGGSHSRREGSLAAIGTAHREDGGSPAMLKAAGVLTTAFTFHDRHGYMVVCMLAWLMAGADRYDVDAIAGRLAHAVKSFLTLGTSFRLSSSLPWRSWLQGWGPTQPDITRWLQHILPKAGAQAMQGSWEARAAHDPSCNCTQAGDTWHPICLQAEVRGDKCNLDLSVLFSEWRLHGDRCALVQAPSILCVVSPRWLNSAAGEWRLVTQGKAPTTVHVPCFSAECDATYNIPYQLMSVVMRGAAGDHFGARYWASLKKTGWHEHANGKSAKPVKMSDTTIYARDCYAVFLRRAEESAIGGTA
eukprot:s1554_g6.t1